MMINNLQNLIKKNSILNRKFSQMIKKFKMKYNF